MSRLHLLLDSGAFSAWSRGQTIDLYSYAAFVEKNRALIADYVVLDAIPGRPGHRRTPGDVEMSATQSFANWRRMRRMGLDPIVVAHQGEHLDHLARYIDEGATYIGISPMADLPSAIVCRWLDLAFRRIDGAAIQTHGFGVTGHDAMRLFPWTTVDSATWIKLAATGGILVPAYENGTLVYNRKPHPLSISRAVKHTNVGGHYDALSPMRQRVVQLFLTEVGTTVDDAATDYRTRMRATAYLLKRMADASGVRLLFAVSDTMQHHAILDELGFFDRLISYALIKHLRPDFLNRLVNGARPERTASNSRSAANLESR